MLSQLSYSPCFGASFSPDQWAWADSNRRPHAYQACALTELSYRPLENSRKSPATPRESSRLRCSPGSAIRPRRHGLSSIDEN
jgi:hypothetical protein